MVTLTRRTTKVISLQCLGCRQWVRPRRWDRAVGLCYPCVALARDCRPPLFDLACDSIDRPRSLGGRHTAAGTAGGG